MGVLSPHLDYDAIKGGGLGLTHGSWAIYLHT